ncbi:hypothetical protein I6G32_16135 [Stutzerimonas stutzeri]|nr:hypothetical protein [Stutzerimonas stutzeri]QPT29314.1 hypothetical protein I6G32_16135 [Stutzerimonas stutzeri]
MHRGMTDRFPYDGIAEGASVVCHETAISIVHRGMADHFPYDGIAEGASVGYRESAASTAQHRNRTHPLECRITPSANPTYVGWTSRIDASLFV